MRMNMSKYKAVRTKVDGISFASKKEARRYMDLCLLLKAGEIRDLVLQPKFPLEVLGVKICTYVADFQYDLKLVDEWFETIEDVKGVRTPVYLLKKKLFEAIYGKRITET